MYICLCHGVTESRIRQAVRDGATCLESLGRETGCGTQCGSCVRQARELLTETLEEGPTLTGLNPLPVV